MGVPVMLVALSDVHWPWIRQSAVAALCEDTKGIVAIRGNIPVAAVVFDNWSYNACMAHILIENPIVTRRLIRASFNYAFITCNRGVMLASVASDNTASLRFCKGIGFRAVHRIKDGYKIGVDFVLHEMRRDECRWLPSVLEAAA